MESNVSFEVRHNFTIHTTLEPLFIGKGTQDFNGLLAALILY